MARRYGRRAGCNEGRLENPNCCVVAVRTGRHTFISSQCSRRRGFGPDGLYCRVHAKALERGNHLEVPTDEDE